MTFTPDDLFRLNAIRLTQQITCQSGLHDIGKVIHIIIHL